MPDDTDIYKTPSYHCPDRHGVREFAIYLSENESELPVDANVDLPFLVPVASKRAFGVGIKIGAVISAVCTAKAGFVPRCYRSGWSGSMDRPCLFNFSVLVIYLSY